MPTADASSVAELIRRLRILTDAQIDEAAADLGPGFHDASALLRVLERKGYLTSWQSSKLIKGDGDGYFLGGYRILYRIAAGSFGRVFRADDPVSGTIVAVKVLRKRWSEDPHKVELFEREGQVGLTLNHPNIVRILSVSKDASTSQHYIVMEFVEGGNLRDFLQIRKKLSAREALKVLDECAAGLAYAFTRGLSHRDLKPTNILISSQGVCKLVDFGLAELAGEDDGGGTTVDRTVDYAGLEKATGVKAGDLRSDVYFMGCIFYEMLTGRSPLNPTKDKYARMNKQRFENVIPISVGEVDAPVSVLKLLDRMMALNPTERFQTPTQLCDAVRRVIAEMDGGSAHPSEPPGQPTVFMVEANEKLRDAVREKFKEIGWRALLAQDPQRAVLRYKESPYTALIIDAGTAGEDGLDAMKTIRRAAEDLGYKIPTVIILSEEQSDWVKRLPTSDGVSALIRPITMKQLYMKVCEMTGKMPVKKA